MANILLIIKIFIINIYYLAKVLISIYIIFNIIFFILFYSLIIYKYIYIIVKYLFIAKFQIYKNFIHLQEFLNITI